jgi:DNA-binding MarR family transcriptional regulator
MIAIDKTRGCLNFQLRRTSRSLARYYDDALRPHGLRITQFNILAVLAQTGPIAITALADFVGLERSALARNLKPIARQKFVAIAAGNDKRTRTVKLAPAGKRKLDETIRTWHQAQTRLVKKIGRDEASALLRTVAKVDETLRGRRVL